MITTQTIQNNGSFWFIMFINCPPFTPIPEKIFRRARNIFGNGNVYLTIGNQIDELFTGLFSEEKCKIEDTPIESICLISLISAVQYEEEMPDLRFIEALRARIDMAYALHLPENYSGLDAIWLSGLRRQIYTEPQIMESFNELLNRLKNLGLFCRYDDRPYDSNTVVKTITIASLMERVVESMYILLEKLATEESDWLRNVILPQWYERYNRNRSISYWPNFNNDWRAFPQAVGKDLRYLIDKIDHSPVNITEGLPTFLVLKQGWKDLNQAIQND